jgi:aryl-alcohol dehydrogenase-like predicted oxidoreductase
VGAARVSRRPDAIRKGIRMRRFADREVGAAGLGCMGMSWAYTASERDDRESVALVREAVELGVTFRADPEVRLTETWGVVSEPVREGKVRHLGAVPAAVGARH